MNPQKLVTAVVFAGAVIFAGARLEAQTAAPPQPSPKMKVANELYNQQKYAESEAAFTEVVKEEPANGRAWYMLAMSHHSLNKYERAIAAFEKNLAIVPRNANSMYNIACGYARLKQIDKAFEWLDKALKTAPAVTFGADTDADLEILRSDARYAKFREAVDRTRRPCMYSAESRQFDFWIGKWDVLTPQGQKAGVNIIEPFSEGCALMENWTATRGGNGKSVNYYDGTTKKWYQVWVGSGGGATRYVGEFKEGAMRFEADGIGPNGIKVKHRLTFTRLEDGSVRQFAESSNDDGRSWNVSYDFKYVKAR